MLRSSVIGIGLAVTAVLAFQVGGCSSGGGGSGGSSGTAGSGGSSTPGTGGTSTPGTGGTSAGMAGSSAPGAGGTATGTGGTATGTGGTATGTGGTATGTGGTATGTGGTATGTGGTATGTGGTGGSGTGGTGTGGTGTGGTGTGGSGTGGTGTGGAAGTPGFGQPACGTNSAGTAIAKNVTCTAEDVQLCYKNCGPSNIGRKSETCGPGADGGMAYAEMSGCSYDQAGTFACYKVPTTANTECPTGVPMGSAACSVAACTVCNDMGGVAGGMYMDSSGMKAGFCVCVNNKWTCASDTAWPCGAKATAVNPGCQ